jgi:hypothetical protein
MSQYYNVGDETLWNPASGVSRIFLGELAVFEAELGVASGIGPMGADEAQVDPVGLEAFANALVAWHRRSGHPVLRLLAEGFMVTVLALAQRAGTEVRWPPPSRPGSYDPFAYLRAESADLAARMS